MAMHVGEILNLMVNVMLIAYVWYVIHHSTCHHHEAQTEVPGAERPKHHGAMGEDPTHDDPQIQDDKTEERVTLLVEKAMQPVVQWHDAQKRADESKIRSMNIDQHAIMDRQRMFERVTENKLASIKATHLVQEIRLDEAEESARAAAKKELTYQHQREVEELRRQLINQQKKHQEAETKTRGIKTEMSKFLGDVEHLRVTVQEESQRRTEVEVKAEAAVADVARLTYVVEHTRASLDEEKRRREQVECYLAVERKYTRQVNAIVAKLRMSIKSARRLARQKRTNWPIHTTNDSISRYAVANFRLHTADSKVTTLHNPMIHDQVCPNPSSLDDAIDRLSAFSISNSEEKPVMSQQLFVLHPPVKLQHVFIPLQVVIDQPPTVSQQLVLYQNPSVVSTQQVDEQAENESTSPLRHQPTAPSGSAIGPISGMPWHANPKYIFGARHVLPKPKGKKHEFSTDQIEKMKSEASEAPPASEPPPARLKTHFSSGYLTRLRARMADISIIRKLVGDDIDEDDDCAVQVRQKDQEFGEAALCNMSEETQYAVPPYTKHMIEQMMESFFLACVWDTLDDEFDLEPHDQEDYRKSFMEAVKKHMDSHPADTLPSHTSQASETEFE